MAYQEDEQVRLRRRRSKQAIALALQGQWREAVMVNMDIIESFPNDVDAYNRLGRAYMELGEYSRAREAYRRAIEIDPYNTIARKNLHRLAYLGEAVTSLQGESHKAEPQHFIEEIGKAGVVNLHHLAPRETLVRMSAGDEVNLRIAGASLIVANERGEYLGQVEPKYGQRLIKLMRGGNEYTAAIVISAEDRVTVIIREVYQAPGQAGRLSFPSKHLDGLRSYIGDRIFRRELEYEQELVEEPGYTIIGDGSPELLPEEFLDIDDKADNEE
jgi:tetratricopeptide (TPR) repeat protein